MTATVLLFCGLLAALFDIGTDVLAAITFPAYSDTAQTISELSGSESCSSPRRATTCRDGLDSSLRSW